MIFSNFQKELIRKSVSYKFISFVILLLIIITTEIVMTVMIPEWRKYFYNILEIKDHEQFYYSIWLFFLLMFLLGAAQGLKTYIGQLISVELRKSGTKILLKRWVYSDKIGVKTPKNYTQAQTEALRQSTELYMNSLMEIVISAAIVILLLGSSNNFYINLSAAVYTILMTAAATIFNRPLIMSDIFLQENESKYREALFKIAEENGDFTAKEKLANLIKSFYKYSKILMYFTLFSRLKSSLAVLVPYLLMAPAYFSNKITLGEFMQSTALFELLVINSTIIIILYPQLTKAKASARICEEFYNEISHK